MRTVLLSVVLLLLVACSGSKEPREARSLEVLPVITPDYVDVTIPPQIAPLRFRLEVGGADIEAMAVLRCGEKKMLTRADRKGNFLFDEEEWKELMEGAAGKRIEVLVYRKTEGAWQRYAPFHWQVAVEPADRYLAYRLIEPGYVLWNKMGIYQRDITTYRQKSILENDLTRHNCMNCHTFLNRRPQKMLFHMRAELGGTYLIEEGNPEKVKLGDDPRVKSLVYPSWHPSGRVVAFSVNKTRQEFHRNDPNRVEVYDSESDVVLYDVRRKKVLVDSVLFSSSAFETFPHFSPDGGRLYFCSARAVERMPEDFKAVKYSLCAIDFDVETCRFGTRVDTLYNSRLTGRSASFPRVSPDGRFLMFTTASYGNFSIWHKDADLQLLDLREGRFVDMQAANSDEVESYHSWSDNGRWAVFSSRRANGLYTRPYLVYMDAEGKPSKPFVLPQRTPGFYEELPLSYNLPEFIVEEVELDAREFADFSKNN